MSGISFPITTTATTAGVYGLKPGDLVTTSDGQVLEVVSETMLVPAVASAAPAVGNRKTRRNWVRQRCKRKK